MKRLSLATACFLWGTALIAGAVAQPILNRVEQLLRDQVDAATRTVQPAEPGYLGLIANDGGAGVQVLQVVDGHAAQQAGLKKGDQITAINGQPVRTLDDMAQVLSGKLAGAKLQFTATRDGAPQQFNVTLGSRAAPAAAQPNTLPAPSEPAVPIAEAPRPRLGVRSVPVTAAVQRQNRLPSAEGAHVVSVLVDSPAARAEIPLGAVVTAVGDRKVTSPQDLAAAISAAPAGDVQLSYVYQGRQLQKNVVLDAIASAEPPQREVRARVPLPDPPAPGDELETADKPASDPAVQPAAAQEPAQPEDPLTGEPADEAKVLRAPLVENPQLEQQARIDALERHVEKLEARLKALEAELARQQQAAPQDN